MQDAQPGAKLLTLADVQDRTTLGKKTIARMIAAGAFPAAVRTSPGRIAFYEVEVDLWIACRDRVPVARDTRAA